MAKVEEVFDECLEHIMAGSQTIEECLAEHPSFGEELKPLLELALELKQQPAMTMSREAKTRAWQGIMEGIDSERGAGRAWWNRMIGSGFGKAFRRAGVFASAALAALLMVALAGAGIAYASQGSIPGDTLYPVKRVIEQARLTFTNNEQVRARLHLTFANRRMEEIVHMAQKGRGTEFENLLENYTQELEAASQVAGTAPSNTKAEGDPARQEVLARVEEATGHHIEVLEGVLEKAPEEARPGLERALEASQKGHEQALRALGHLGPPAAVPQGREETGDQPLTPQPGATLHVAIIAMWYEQKGPNRSVYTKVNIVDENEQPVSGANVYIETKFPDGSVSSASSYTGGEGTVTFRVLSRQRGTYTSMMKDVMKEGWSYDPTTNMETSESLPVP